MSTSWIYNFLGLTGRSFSSHKGCVIPDMGVNKILDNVLTTVCEDYALRSWSIFHEKDGSISLRIRFDASDRGHGEPNRDAVYRRKSPAQAARDKLRSDRW